MPHARLEPVLLKLDDVVWGRGWRGEFKGSAHKESFPSAVWEKEGGIWARGSCGWPVMGLLLSSPGIHVSRTLLSARSVSSKSRGRSGRSVGRVTRQIRLGLSQELGVPVPIASPGRGSPGHLSPDPWEDTCSVARFTSCSSWWTRAIFQIQMGSCTNCALPWNPTCSLYNWCYLVVEAWYSGLAGGCMILQQTTRSCPKRNCKQIG